jgi:hypothetical protein
MDWRTETKGAFRYGDWTSIDEAVTTRNETETDVYLLFISSFFHFYSFSINMAAILSPLTPVYLYSHHPGFKKT